MAQRAYVSGGSPNCKCGQPRLSGQRVCRACKDNHRKGWRAKLTGVPKLKADAMNVVHAAVSRGTLLKMPCDVCLSPDVRPFHFDYHQPRRVRWLCKDCAAEHNPMQSSPIPEGPAHLSSSFVMRVLGGF